MSAADDLDALLRQRLPPPGGWLATPLRLAAVVCPLVVHDGQDHLLFAVRPEGQHQHAGQIGFPGGMRSGAEDPVACALRECHEEIGVPPAAVQVLGALPPRESSSGILVHCVVARLAPVPLRPDPDEVVRLLHVPLAELRDDGRWQERTPPPSATGYQPRTSPHFAFASDAGPELLWGLTARFVRDLVARLRA
ncbi:MAG: CoA pyrophosphatase [Planctomycetes bacterium]|nr:CoA pyrophosphatase [Planctomycetota bacterium]